jgi:hypothetical protein
MKPVEFPRRSFLAGVPSAAIALTAAASAFADDEAASQAVDSPPVAPPPPPIAGDAGDTVPDAPAPDDGWRAEFALEAWLLGIDGTLGVRGRSADVRATFFDILDATDSLIGFGARAEVGHGRLAAYLDGMYDRATVDGATGPLGIVDIDVTFEESILDFGLMYRVAQVEPGPPGTDSAPRADFNADLYLGGRFQWLSLELDPALQPPVSGEKSWTDPLVGMRLEFPLGDGLRLAVNGDVGGFGVSSEFTWSATALVALDFRLFGAAASVELGYRALASDYIEGSGSTRFEWDVVQHGALLGFSLRF